MSDVPPPDEGQAPTPEPQPYAGQGQQYPPAAPQPAYGPGFRPKHPQAILILVLGIVGVMFCPATGPFAWIMSNKAIREIDANPDQYEGRSELLIGKILGIVGTILLGLIVLAVIAFVGFIGLIARASI